MVVFPNVKINLGLHVLRKRHDGYHDIETCFYPVPLTDVLEAVPSDTFSFRQTGIIIDSSPEENLCVKAYRMLEKEFSIPPVAMHLHKCVPAGAGLGGGSSDAAFTLKLMNDLFGMELTNAQLEKHASLLGSDCSFFIKNIPSLGTETGSRLTPLDISLSGLTIVIVRPDIHVSTSQAYAGLHPEERDESIAEILLNDRSAWQGKLVNDFTTSSGKAFPEIKAIVDAFYRAGAIYASMTGSGSAVYGLFETSPPLFPEFADYFQWSHTLS